MEAIRGFTNANRSMIVNAIYILAFLIVVYYIYKFLTAGSDLDFELTGDPLSASSISTDSIQRITGRVDSNGKPLYPKCRIKTGGEFTMSMWVYISSYDGAGFQGLPKSVFTILDDAVPNNYLMIGVLYPNENKMMIRAYTGTNDSYTGTADGGSYKQLMSGNTPTAFTSGMPQCDIQDIDMQRWVNLVISVNGRIMDVYMDGKLARSCILPNVIKTGVSGNQTITMGGFPGQYSRVRYINYAATPDQIYAIYQDGPYKPNTLVNYVGKMFGIDFIYKDVNGSTQKL